MIYLAEASEEEILLSSNNEPFKYPYSSFIATIDREVLGKRFASLIK